MSADNVIIIKGIKDVWHVWHASMSCFIEGESNPPKGNNERHHVFESLEETKTYAKDLEKEIEYVEYGIVQMGTLSETRAKTQKQLDQKAVEDIVNEFKEEEKNDS